MVVGQAPDFWSDKDNRPFSGKSGKLLGLLLDAAGVPRNAVFYTNAVRCLPPGRPARKPKRDEIDNCRDYLLEEIRLNEPKVIVTLGETALTALYAIKSGAQEHSLNIGVWEQDCRDITFIWEKDVEEWQSAEKKTRGPKPRKPKLPYKPRPPKAVRTVIKDVAGHTLIQPDTGIPLVPSYHPSYLMADKWEQAEMLMAHLSKAWRIVRGKQKVGKLAANYPVIKSLDALKALRDYLLSPAVDTIWYDTETTGLKWHSDELLCISLSGAPGEGYVVPILHNPGDGNPALYPAWDGKFRSEVLPIIQEIFGSEKDKGGQNMLFDMRMLERDRSTEPYISAQTAFGIKVNGTLKDTELLHHSIAESLPHNMTQNLALWTDMPFYEDGIKIHKKAMAKAPNELMWPYSGADADGLPRMWNAMRPVAESEGVDWVLDNLTAPMLQVCRELERNGFPVDMPHFQALCKFYEQEILLAEEALWDAVPHRSPGWSYASSPELRQVLFQELGLPTSGRKTKSSKDCEDCSDGVCFEHDQTGKDALLDIQKLHPHPVIPAIMVLKNLTKRKATYLDGGRGGMLRYIRKDGRIHPSMKISRAETGRLASEEPNEQNIPNYVHIHQNGDTCAGAKCIGVMNGCVEDHDHCKAFYANTTFMVTPPGVLPFMYHINTTNAFHDIIRAGSKKVIINVDWSQLEIWVLAYRIQSDLGDTTLLDILMSGVDIHLWMARKMYSDVDPGMTDKEWKAAHSILRRRAKTANFGIGYGLTIQGFMAREGCTEEEAEDTFKRFKDIVPIDAWFKVIRKQLFANGYVENEFKRRRHIRYLRLLKAMGEMGALEAAIREGINFPIQSGGSDLHSATSYQILLAKVLRDRGCKLILSVHDSLTFEADAPDMDYAKHTGWIIREIFQKVAWFLTRPDGNELNWKIPCEVEIGPTWGTPELLLNAKGNWE